MGKRGPAKKPRELDDLQGNPGKRPRAPAPVAPDGQVECPDWLDDEARAEWDRIAPVLSNMKMMKPSFRALIAVYCDAWSEFVACVLEIRHSGRTSAEVAAKSKAFDRMNRVASKFGLSPSDLAGLDLPPDDDKTGKEAEFFND